MVPRTHFSRLHVGCCPAMGMGQCRVDNDSYLDTYHMGAREYDPSLGRWLSADTIVPEPANPQSLNRFAYVYNNPMKYVDPSGHDPDDIPPECERNAQCRKWWEDKKRREAQEHRTSELPSSYVRLGISTSQGGGLGAGVVVATNAILTHNHVSANVTQIAVFDSSGALLYAAGPGDFEIVIVDGGTTLIVFRNDFIPEANVAPMGDVDDLATGSTAEQAVYEGATRAAPGLYSTTIEHTDVIIYNTAGVPYRAITVSPDFTIPGDSGSPLYVDGRVYGINNSGNGNYGAIRNPENINSLIVHETLRLKLREPPSKPQGNNTAS